MADKDVSRVPSPNSEHARIAAESYEYAKRAVTAGNRDLAIQLLRTSCKHDPANMQYRNSLRKVQKTRWNNNLRGSLLAPLTTWLNRIRLSRARSRGDHLRVLEYGEAILAKNPWNTGVQLLMSEAAQALQLPMLAIFLLEQARDKNPRDAAVNRPLARLYEKQGQFPRAIQLWELVRDAVPTDNEAQSKSRQLAATETIARGNYEEAVSGDPSTRTMPRVTTGTSTEHPKLGAAKPPANSDELAKLRTRVAAEPGRPEGYLQLAAYLAKQGQIDEARQALEQGLEPTGKAGELQIALVELELDPYRKALSDTEKKLRNHPDDAKLLEHHGKVLGKINKREIELYRIKANHYPSEKSHRYELGVRLFRASKFEEAIAEFQAVRSEPRFHWQSLLHLGHCFRERRNWPLARRNYEEALQRIPAAREADRKEILFQLAFGHAGAGDLSRAIELGLDLANLDYSYQNIGKLLEDWQREQDSTRAART